ncbi:hypothetical protein ACLEC0_12135 [Lonsdalea quercina]|uniref:hypothetical protein n=1 Tax=Lonsdalea quercina TaxID=71657 RepID=UPI003975E155
MPLDIAYSIEIEDFIDPDKAYDLYWSGIIKDNHAFVCPGTDCQAQVTSANLYVESQDMKVVPHFRVYGKHSNSCEVFNNKKYPSYKRPILLKKKKESLSVPL